MSVNAARPTYFAAVGGGNQTYGGVRSRQQCAKDQTAHTKLKYRVIGQSSVEEMSSKNLKDQLDESVEKQLKEQNKALGMLEEAETKVDVPLLLKAMPEVDTAILHKYDDADADVDFGDGKSEDGFDSSSDEDDDDEDDDEAELQAELDRIKQERAAAQLKKEEEEQEIKNKLLKDSAIKGNPLLNTNGSDQLSAKVKRRWNDDVVFRHQTRDEPEAKKRFINDAIRSDFHRSFLKKFIK